MNKIKFTFPLAVLLALSVSFSSCNRDDDNPLVGTTWVNEWIEDENFYERTTLQFTGETRGTITSSWRFGNESGNQSDSFTYSYDNSNINLTLREGGVTMTISGVVRGSTMTFDLFEGETWVFTRQ